MRCPKANCGGSLEPQIVEFGRVVFRCEHCARKRARICRDCGGRTPSTRHWRCLSCAKRHRNALGVVKDRLRYATRRHQLLANHAKRRADPVIRAWRKQYMADYRLANPRDHHDRAYGREYMRTRRADPAYRLREQRRKRERRALARKAAA